MKDFREVDWMKHFDIKKDWWVYLILYAVHYAILKYASPSHIPPTFLAVYWLLTPITFIITLIIAIFVLLAYLSQWLGGVLF